jgi:hypothetical protein
MDDTQTDGTKVSVADESAVKKLTPAARRALAEAAARREANAAQVANEAKRPKEISGRDGPDPARYGDWENKGIISDF